MRDLLRSHPPMLDGSSNGLEVESWLLDLGRCFSMHPYGSNTKARCVIMHLHDFTSTWWHMEEKKLYLDITTVSWELFLEQFCVHLLSDAWKQRKADEFYNLS